MFGKRQLKPAALEEVPIAAPAAPSGRSAMRSPAQAMKPRAAPPPPPPPRIRRPRGGLLSMMSEAMTLGLVVGGAITFGILVVSHEVHEAGPLETDKVVLIPKGAGTSEIATLLGKEGVITNPMLFELYAYANRSKGQLKAGEFQFKARTDIAEAIDTLIQGKAILHSVTIPEGLTSEQIVERLRDNEILAGDVNETPREGSLLPDTYRFERGTTRRQVVNMMQAAGREAVQKAWTRRAPDLTIRTPQELLILASIVEKETGKGDERARVAGVFVNRLSRRMKLQSDPTIVYGLVGGKGTLGRGITRAEIDRATPYNTYVIEGLPPGPIANPGKAAIEAVANPTKTKELFFVADGTGGHTFAETYDQHLRNVARWRQIESQRQSLSPSGGDVDRAAPTPAPDQRSDGGAVPGSVRSAGFLEDRRPAAAPQAAGRAFDAVEGTPRDPLANRTWDLTTAKNVPGFGAEVAPAPTRAAPQAKPARTARRPARAAEASAEGGRAETR